MTTTHDKIIADFSAYIDTFNAEDIDAVSGHLDANIQIHVNGTLQGEGRDKLLPIWQADMDRHRRVEVSKGPACTLKDNAIAEVSVELTATVKKDGAEDEIQVLSVVYVYDTTSTSLRQIRHEITV